jgi:hypothetical protein
MDCRDHAKEDHVFTAVEFVELGVSAMRYARRWSKQNPAMFRGAVLLLLLVLLPASVIYGYSVLTHEAIVDSVWDSSIQKLLLKRFPAATPEELLQAHAYAYGGCIHQDMGYYPFSSRLFSDLTHYVRSGDYIAALLRESEDLNEYAFALGALAHYAADNNGHRIATNLAVPIMYPELRRKFGQAVTYSDDAKSHIQTEFSFDVLQVATGRYAPEGYRHFIGFQVAKPVMERAFRDTYGLDLKDDFGNLGLALGSFRYSVSSIIPNMTRVAWNLKGDELRKEIPGITRKKFLYNLSRASYEKEWGTEYQKPTFRTRFETFLVRILPHSGPFKSLRFRTPTPEVEKMFMASFNATVDSYKSLLANVGEDKLDLANDNFDIGVLAQSGQYRGGDETYAKLLNKLADRKFAGVPEELRQNILDFYKDAHAPVPGIAKPKQIAEWAGVLAKVAQLQAVTVSSSN